MWPSGCLGVESGRGSDHHHPDSRLLQAAALWERVGLALGELRQCHGDLSCPACHLGVALSLTETQLRDLGPCMIPQPRGLMSTRTRLDEAVPYVLPKAHSLAVLKAPSYDGVSTWRGKVTLLEVKRKIASLMDCVIETELLP